jgi:hypothetical protein
LLQLIGYRVQLGGITSCEFFSGPKTLAKEFLQERDSADLTATRFADFNASRFASCLAFQCCLFHPGRFITLKFQSRIVS